jgi:hypothetical protein
MFSTLASTLFRDFHFGLPQTLYFIEFSGRDDGLEPATSVDAAMKTKVRSRIFKPSKRVLISPGVSTTGGERRFAL